MASGAVMPCYELRQGLRRERTALNVIYSLARQINAVASIWIVAGISYPAILLAYRVSVNGPRVL